MAIIPGTPMAGAAQAERSGPYVRPLMIDIASLWVVRKCPVFPVRPGRKEPIGSMAPRGHLDATLDMAQVTAWWSRCRTANVGIHCAAAGLYVVDIDEGIDPDDGRVKVGLASWAALVGGRPLPATFTVRTPRGGLHYYYRSPDRYLSNTTSRLARDVDTRGNGYVLVPGSTVDGVPYVVVDDTIPAKLPVWLFELLRRPTAPPRRVVAAGSSLPARSRGARTPAVGGHDCGAGGHPQRCGVPDVVADRYPRGGRSDRP